MENRINIAELLKDCPRGMKLYSPIFGEVTLDSVEENLYPIEVKTKNQNIKSFIKDGRWNESEDGECLLFPSKDHRTWQDFKKPQEEYTFQVGDAVTFDNDCNS